MDILNKTKSNVEIKDKALKSVIKIDDAVLNLENIFKRTFKDNIKINDTTLPVPFNFLWNKEQAWNFYNNYSSWTGKDDHEKSKFIVKECLKAKGYPEKPVFDFNYPNNTKVAISKEEFFSALDDNFVWKEDDLFENQIGKLFYDFASKRHDEKARLGCLQGGFDNDKYIENAPWTILNNLFERLKFNYRFKKDYEFETPNLKEIPLIYSVLENGNVDESSPRQLKDLSDGEKSIISLTFALLNEKNRPMEKLLLLDEFDNTLNPSLIEALFIVIKDFFIEKGTMVIITTHSPVTISLAPEYARFYELFRQENDSPKIVEVNKEEYSELEIANRAFYEKIENQKERICKLEEKINQLKAKKILFVEDKYTQIYKVAWLKLHDYDFDKNNLEEIFEKNSPFKIYPKNGRSSLKGFLNNPYMEENDDRIILGLFDFDEAYQDFCDLKDWWGEAEGSESDGIYKVNNKYNNIKAMLLPVPEYRKNIAAKNQTIKKLEIELLFKDEDIDEILGKEHAVEKLCDTLIIPHINRKDIFWEKTIGLDKDKFSAFAILYRRVHALLEI